MTDPIRAAYVSLIETRVAESRRMRESSGSRAVLEAHTMREAAEHAAESLRRFLSVRRQFDRTADVIDRLTEREPESF